MTAAYSAPVSRHSFSVRFLPGDTRRQRIGPTEVHISGGVPVLEAKDAFGNRRVYGTIGEAHDRFGIRIRGSAETGLDILEERAADPLAGALFAVQTPLTLPGPALRAYHGGMGFSDPDGPYDRAIRILRRLHACYPYAPGRTRAHERAEDAFVLGGGVCQDYAHIMLSQLRMEKIPARYAVGMLLGEGASHAWVEVLCRGCWYGMDPANGLLVDDRYIRVSCGRDSRDCAVIRGSFLGSAVQTQQEKACVEETERKGA